MHCKTRSQRGQINYAIWICICKGEQLSQIWMPTKWLVLAFFKIELWNFQDKLDLWFREASQNLSSFRQLFFFIVSKGGPKGKCWKIANCFFIIFPLVPPRKLWKKNCLNELKFWEASGNHNSSLSWKFHNSISKKAKTSQLSASISEKVVPL